MILQGYRLKVRVTLRGEDPQVESVLVRDSLSSNLIAEGLRIVAPYHTTGLSRHTHRLDYILAHTNPIKQLRQDVELLLKPVCRC